MKSLSNPLGKRLCVSTNYAIISNVESIREIEPLFHKYIKDQSLLESTIEESNKSFIKKNWNCFWGLTSGYGTNITLWCGWALFFVFIYGIIYWLHGGFFASVNLSFFDSLYMSIQTFILLSVPDYNQQISTIAKYIRFSEAFVGIFMLAGLISIFSVRMARFS